MPEYPDITIYIEALASRILGETIQAVSLRSPFLLRLASPPIDAYAGTGVVAVERMGKRIVIGFAPPSSSDRQCRRWMVFHLMIAGRLHWRAPREKAPGRNALIVLEFESGVLTLTEAGSKKRASLHLFDLLEALQELDPGGLEVFDADCDAFSAALTASNHTLKRALTDPRILSGIGNAYSDEILHRAKLSPFVQTQKLTSAEIERLRQAVTTTLLDWTQRLRDHYGERFPEKVTAFREGMAVHGRFNQPCPVCQSPVQRICYATNETNYCPTCQTEGKILADRVLSRLLKKDWPRSLEELEKM
ncbi:MAG: formamidopyrimidine-DNA glycosylase [Planctomycetes bacterium]|nr:formamidopyrimidine-DNA glycosylase [Planctomycetota bacterium]